jgi:polar amino acid transport system substrate-binding protein
MKLAQVAFIIFLSAAVAFVTGKYAASTNASGAVVVQESAFDRVMRSGTIRCGYAVYAPYFTKDPATGAFGGIWHDFTEAVADHLGLKVVWAEEVGLADVGVALDTGKIDVYCAALWSAGKRVRAVNFLKPSAYEPMLMYVRADDHRFDSSLNDVNDPSVRISTIDGEGGGLIAAEDFPKATQVSLPQLVAQADMFKQVVTRKADIVIAAPSGAAAFTRNNPGVLRPILEHPLRLFSDSLAVRYGEDKLRDMLNQAQDDVIFNGGMEKILSKYEVNKGDFWRVAKPYDPPQ